MSAKTHEPWSWIENADANTFVIAQGNKWIVGLIHNGEPLPEQQKENMRRIVACVNACAPFTTEQLEQHSYKNSVVNEMLKRIEVEMQRNELLAALNDVVSIVENYAKDTVDMTTRLQALLPKCVDAIAKAEAA